ncbi:MAG: hypothetical protein AAGJ35_13150, partial [Myxococcota bacterium]
MVFVDTFEYLATRERLQSHRVKTQVDRERFKPLGRQQKGLELEVFSVWLNAWLGFLRQQGALVVVAGRTVAPWDRFVEQDLADFQRAELLKFVRASEYPTIQQIWRECSGLRGWWQRWRGRSCRLDALLEALTRLSFGGKPLWVRVGLNCLADLLKNGRNIDALVENEGDLQTCFEQDLAAVAITDTENAACKLAVFTHVMRETDDQLVEQVWKLALPRRLDQEVLEVLFGEQAETLLAIYGNMGILLRKRGVEDFILHEEIRDLLQFYAREKGLWESAEAMELHERLAELFEKRSWRVLPKLDDFEWQDWGCLVEVFYHQSRGKETDSNFDKTKDINNRL